MTLLARIAALSSPEPNTGCWLWLGYVGADGYPLIGGAHALNPGARTHRVSRVLLALTTPDLFACHRCDQPLCVNPAHLFAGTHADNMRDMGAKGRNPRSMKTHCSRGHAFDPDNTFTTGRQTRVCRICRRDAKRASRARAAAK